MNFTSWKHNSTAPMAIKALVGVSVVATAFYLFHTIIQFVMQDAIDNGTYYIAPWTQELYFLIWMALPFVLAVVGTSIYRPRTGKILLGFTFLFAIGHLLNIGNTYEWIDIPHLQYPQTVALLGILVVWIISVLKRKKNILDALKFIWLLGLVYSFAVPRFVRSGHEAGNFLLASMFIFPFMMIVGFYFFYRKPQPNV